MPSTYYKASGKISSSSFLHFLVFSILIIPILAFLYAHISWLFGGIAHLGALIILGVALGYGLKLTVIKWGKVRNGLIAGLFGATASLIAYYIYLAIWVGLLMIESLAVNSPEISYFQPNVFLSLLTHPGEMLDVLQEVNQQGTPLFLDVPISGVLLYLVWLVELGILTFITIYTSYYYANFPYNEPENHWINKSDLPPLQYIMKKTQFVKSIENGEASVFDDIKPITKHYEDQSIFSLYLDGHGENFLSITNYRADKSEGDSFHDDKFVEFIRISDHHLKVLNSKFL